MKTKLITGLRTAANALEQGTFYYKWEEPSCCNCGSLFCALTGESAQTLNASLPPLLKGTNSTWANRIGQNCPITGIPTVTLFKELYSYGLTQQDMINLEYLRDANIVKRTGLIGQGATFWKTGITKLDYHNKYHVIAYMRAWADLLIEEGAMDVAEPAAEPATQSA